MYLERNLSHCHFMQHNSVLTGLRRNSYLRERMEDLMIWTANIPNTHSWAADTTRLSDLITCLMLTTLCLKYSKLRNFYKCHEITRIFFTYVVFILGLVGLLEGLKLGVLLLQKLISYPLAG